MTGGAAARDEPWVVSLFELRRYFSGTVLAQGSKSSPAVGVPDSISEQNPTIWQELARNKYLFLQVISFGERIRRRIDMYQKWDILGPKGRSVRSLPGVDNGAGVAKQIATGFALRWSGLLDLMARFRFSLRVPSAESPRTSLGHAERCIPLMVPLAYFVLRLILNYLVDVEFVLIGVLADVCFAIITFDFWGMYVLTRDFQIAGGGIVRFPPVEKDRDEPYAPTAFEFGSIIAFLFIHFFTYGLCKKVEQAGSDRLLDWVAVVFFVSASLYLPYRLLARRPRQ